MRSRHLFALLAFVATAAAGPAFGEVTMPNIFGDRMVLQRGMQVPFYGKAAPGEQVTVTVAGKTATTTADEDGAWKVAIGPLPVANALKVSVAGTNKLTFDDVLVGDVWVCSGQSNMAWRLAAANNAEQEIADADHPNIRLYTVKSTVSHQPLADVPGEWQVCEPGTARTFSAVGYFFGRDLHKKLGVPIGLINSSWGGTPAEAWTPRAALAADDAFAYLLERADTAADKYPELLEKYEEQLAEWEKNTYFVDPGNNGFEKGWASPDAGTPDWKPMALPGKFADADLNIDGVVWFRRAIEIPAAMAGTDLVLELGVIDDLDTTYFAGKQVGATGLDVENFWSQKRAYKVPAELVKAGKTVIAVRLVDRWYDAGFMSPADTMVLRTADGKHKVALAGEWLYKIAAQRPQPAAYSRQPRRPLGPNSPNLASVLYNGMIHPIMPFGIKGAIWYQGESNASRAYEYRTLFPTMIESWRNAWGQGDFPFLFVQLANFMAVQEAPVENSAWAELREAQTLTLKLPNTAMASAIDIGEATDIHPRNKQEVGRRLALGALKVVYGRDIVATGPTFGTMEVQGRRVVVRFKSVGGGLVPAEGEALKGFAIAGKDREFVWADAVIDGATVILSSEQVAEPVAVRYGWANNPIGNLYNIKGLPANPFRSDDWPGITWPKSAENE